MLFVVNVDFHGTVAIPPTIANVSMSAAGATAVKNVDCIILDPFLNPKLNSFLIPDIKAPPQVAFSLWSPS